MTTDHRQQAIQAAAEALRDLGWMCDPYGHEDGPQATGACRDCDALVTSAAEVAVAAAEPHLRALVAEAIRDARVVGVADRAVLGDGDWRLRSGAENAKRVAEAVRDAAARIAEGTP